MLTNMQRLYVAAPIDTHRARTVTTLRIVFGCILMYQQRVTYAAQKLWLSVL